MAENNYIATSCRKQTGSYWPGPEKRKSLISGIFFEANVEWRVLLPSRKKRICQHPRHHIFKSAMKNSHGLFGGMP